VPPSSERDQFLDCFAFVHRPIAIRHLAEAGDPTKGSTRFDPAFEDVWQKFLDVCAGLTHHTSGK